MMPDSCFFQLHVIPPPRPLGWESPRALLRDTLWHHLIQDPAPIGHFYIEVRNVRPNVHGVSHFLTGMSRSNRFWSSLKVVRARVGLGTFFYDFPGDLDRATEAARALRAYRRQGRLKTLRVPLSPERADLLFEELHQWIRHGSFRHYGGGHRIVLGEGSGCADMGAHFLRLALDCTVIPKEWIREVYAPNPLIGDKRAGREVSLLRVYREGSYWAEGPGDGRLYSTPDMELAWAWLEKRQPGSSEIVLSSGQVDWSGPGAQRIDFQAGYPLEAEDTIGRVWRQVQVFF